MARCDSARTTVPVKPPPSNVWKVASMVVRPAASTMARHLARNPAPSRSSCGSQRQPVRSPMRCRPFIFSHLQNAKARPAVSSLAFHPRLAAQTALFDRAQFVQNLLYDVWLLIDSRISVATASINLLAIEILLGSLGN